MFGGAVVAAINARSRSVKLDFLLPKKIAVKHAARGELSIKGRRRGGVWVQTSVGKRITLDQGKRLLSDALTHEFGPKKAITQQRN